MKNYLKISELISCSGQPKENKLRMLHKNYEVVINLGLLDQDYSIQNEEEIIHSQNISYFHIPVIFENPTVENLLEFISTMNEQKNKNILVHCAANYRASVFTSLYLFYTKQITKVELEKIILDVWQPNDTWQNFLDDQIKIIEEKS